VYEVLPEGLLYGVTQYGVGPYVASLSVVRYGNRNAESYTQEELPAMMLDGVVVVV
jgi:hypothetical protein